MTLRTMIILGIVEQVIMFAYIMPTSGWWFSFFGISAIWTLVSSSFESSEKDHSDY